MKFSSLLTLIVAFATVLTGCDSNSSPDGSQVSLSFAATTFNQSAAPKSGHVSLSEAKILVRAIQFHGRSDNDSLSFRTDPVVVNLRTDSGVTELQVSDIPAGTYHKISFRIHKPGETETPPDPEFKIGQGGQERFSVVAKGQFAGLPFTYRTFKSMHQTVTLDEDLVIDGTETDPINLTLLVDVNEWFIGNGGVSLDPTTTSSSTMSHIDKSIRESFRLFKDKNRDGQRDN